MGGARPRAAGASHLRGPHSFIHSFTSPLHASTVPGASAHTLPRLQVLAAVRRVLLLRALQATEMGLQGPATSSPGWARPPLSPGGRAVPPATRLLGNPERDCLGSGVFAEVISLRRALPDEGGPRTPCLGPLRLSPAEPLSKTS